MPDVKVRRATIEDLPKLTALWAGSTLQEPDLEKRFRDFQVAENDQGELVGALAIQVNGQEGMLDCEVYADFEQADALRPQLWERARVLAQNFGLRRLWTQLPHEFFQTSGFQFASTELLNKLPAAFTKGDQPWLFLQLKDEAAALSLDKEFALFKEAEHESTARIFRQARVLKAVALIMATLLVGLVIVWAVWFIKLPKPQ